MVLDIYHSEENGGWNRNWDGSMRKGHGWWGTETMDVGIRKAMLNHS